MLARLIFFSGSRKAQLAEKTDKTLKNSMYRT